MEKFIKEVQNFYETFFQYVKGCSEPNIAMNNSFKWCSLTSSQINWADIENCLEFLSEEMPDIIINDNRLFEEIRRLVVYLNPNYNNGKYEWKFLTILKMNTFHMKI